MGIYKKLNNIRKERLKWVIPNNTGINKKQDNCRIGFPPL